MVVVKSVALSGTVFPPGVAPVEALPPPQGPPSTAAVEVSGAVMQVPSLGSVGELVAFEAAGTLRAHGSALGLHLPLLAHTAYSSRCLLARAAHCSTWSLKDGRVDMATKGSVVPGQSFTGERELVGRGFGKKAESEDRTGLS